MAALDQWAPDVMRRRLVRQPRKLEAIRYQPSCGSLLCPAELEEPDI